MNFERTAVESVARIAPWLAPLPTAWLVFDRTQTHLQWPVWVAVAAAVAVECLGLATTATALEFREYNGDKLKSEPGAPVILAGVLACAYFVTALTLTVALDIVPVAATYAPAVFPGMSLVAMALLAMRAGHVRRIAANESQRNERRQLRRQRRSERLVAQEQPAERFFFPCKVAGCEWPGRTGGYDSPQAAQNALNAHASSHRVEVSDNGRGIVEDEREIAL